MEVREVVAPPMNTNRHAGEIVKSYNVYCGGCDERAFYAEDNIPVSTKYVRELLVKNRWAEREQLWYCPKCQRRDDFPALIRARTEQRLLLSKAVMIDRRNPILPQQKRRAKVRRR